MEPWPISGDKADFFRQRESPPTMPLIHAGQTPVDLVFAAGQGPSRPSRSPIQDSESSVHGNDQALWLSTPQVPPEEAYPPWSPGQGRVGSSHVTARESGGKHLACRVVPDTQRQVESPGEYE